MVTTIRSQNYLDEIKVISKLKRCSDKKTEGEREREGLIKSPAFLLNAAIWSLLALSQPSLNYMWEAKYKTLANNLQTIRALTWKQLLFKYKDIQIFKRFTFLVCFICLHCYMHLSKLIWKYKDTLYLAFNYI